jgi:hypothetical protein
MLWEREIKNTLSGPLLVLGSEKMEAKSVGLATYSFVRAKATEPTHFAHPQTHFWYLN